MLLYSCRRDFSSNYRFGLPQLRDGSLPENKRVLILVHGYRNNETAAAKAYITVEEKLRQYQFPYDEVIGFLWPGSGISLGFLAAVGRANKAAQYLADLVRQLQERGCEVSVQTHSLGARVALQAIKQYGVKLKDLILLAPAVDANVFSPKGEFKITVNNITECFIIGYSSQDDVLKDAYWTAEVISNLFSGKAQKALGLYGPSGKYPVAQLKLINGSVFIISHSSWKSEEKGYQAWKELVA